MAGWPSMSLPDFRLHETAKKRDKHPESHSVLVESGAAGALLTVACEDLISRRRAVLGRTSTCKTTIVEGSRRSSFKSLVPGRTTLGHAKCHISGALARA